MACAVYLAWTPIPCQTSPVRHVRLLRGGEQLVRAGVHRVSPVGGGVVELGARVAVRLDGDVGQRLDVVRAELVPGLGYGVELDGRGDVRLFRARRTARDERCGASVSDSGRREKRNNERATAGKLSDLEGGAPLWGSIGGASGVAARDRLTVDPGYAAGTHPCSWSSGIAGLAVCRPDLPVLADPLGSCRTSASACCRGAPGAGVAGTPRRSAGRRRRRRGDRDPVGRSPEARWTSAASETRRVRCRRVDSVRVDRITPFFRQSHTPSKVCAAQCHARCHVRSAETKSPTAALQSSLSPRVDVSTA